MLAAASLVEGNDSPEWRYVMHTLTWSLFLLSFTLCGPSDTNSMWLSSPSFYHPYFLVPFHQPFLSLSMHHASKWSCKPVKKGVCGLNPLILVLFASLHFMTEKPWTSATSAVGCGICKDHKPHAPLAQQQRWKFSLQNQSKLLSDSDSPSAIRLRVEALCTEQSVSQNLSGWEFLRITFSWTADAGNQVFYILLINSNLDVFFSCLHFYNSDCRSNNLTKISKLFSFQPRFTTHDHS